MTCNQQIATFDIAHGMPPFRYKLALKDVSYSRLTIQNERKNATKKSIPADLGVRLQIHQIVVFPTILLTLRLRIQS